MAGYVHARILGLCHPSVFSQGCQACDSLLNWTLMTGNVSLNLYFHSQGVNPDSVSTRLSIFLSHLEVFVHFTADTWCPPHKEVYMCAACAWCVPPIREVARVSIAHGIRCLKSEGSKLQHKSGSRDVRERLVGQCPLSFPHQWILSVLFLPLPD